MNREYHQWWSERLRRNMELLVFGHAGAKVLVFPSRLGRFYEYEKLGLVHALKHKLEQGHLQLYCVDSIDAESFYCAWAHPSGRIRRHVEFEEYILNEVLPFMQSKNPHECVISHGLSLGAFHAANITFRYPHLFKKLVAFSGRYDLTLSVEHFNDLFEGYYNEDIYFHTPTHFMIGKEDPFLQNYEHLSAILSQKDIKHQMPVWEGRAHSGSYWRRMVGLYL